MATTTARPTGTGSSRRRSHSAQVNEQRVQEAVEAKEEQKRITTARQQEQDELSNEVIDATGAKRPLTGNQSSVVADDVVVVEAGPDTDEALFAAAEAGDLTALAKLKNRLQKARHEAGNSQLQGGVQVVDDQFAIVRMSHTLEDFTYGPMHFPVLKQGQRYKLPNSVAKYLDGLGYVWH